MSAAEQLVLGGWIQPDPDEPLEEFKEERDALLRSLEKSELSRIEQRVAYILRKFPETRDNTSRLAITYWRYWQPEVLDSCRPMELEVLYDLHNFETIARSRRHIQNDLKLFQGSEFVIGLRNERQRDFLQHVLERKNADPEIRFYLDETGNSTTDRFTGVGGVCVMDWRLFEIQHAAIRKARQGLGPETLHCADIKSNDDLLRHVALLAELQHRRAGLLFVGHATRSRIAKQEILCSLFVQLVVDALRKMEAHGCLETQRVLTVVKEADEGFDALMGEDFQVALQEAVARALGDKIYVNPIRAVPKGREVMLECADQIAFAMMRRAVSGGRIAKDRLAEAVMNVTGFEDPGDSGAVFKIHAR